MGTSVTSMTSGIPCQRYLCVGCGAVLALVPRGVELRRHYERAAICLALGRWALADQATTVVRAQIEAWPSEEEARRCGEKQSYLVPVIDSGSSLLSLDLQRNALSREPLKEKRPVERVREFTLGVADVERSALDGTSHNKQPLLFIVTRAVLGQ